jgi:hypothetical protein
MPDLRMGQLLENMAKIYGLFPCDSNFVYLWGQEDDKTEEILDRIIAELNSKNK